MTVQCIIVIALISAVFAYQKPFWTEDESQPNSHDYFLNLVDEDDDKVWSYAGITTFAHLPFINCLSPAYTDEAKEKFDIAIVGAPFDTSVTYRPG
jgi:agmatinase